MSPESNQMYNCVSREKKKASYVFGHSAHQHHSKQDQRDSQQWPSHGCVFAPAGVLNLFFSVLSQQLHITPMPCCAAGDVRSRLQLNYSSPSRLKCLDRRDGPEDVFGLVLRRRWSELPDAVHLSHHTSHRLIPKTYKQWQLLCLVFTDTEPGD